MSISSQSSGLPDLSWFNSYHDYADHRLFFEDLNAAFPNNSDIFTTGKSYQGREIYGIHFWGRDGKDTKPAIFFHATVHAREWIAAPVCELLRHTPLVSQYFVTYALRNRRPRNISRGSSSTGISAVMPPSAQSLTSTTST